jgi:hypothetical protein
VRACVRVRNGCVCSTEALVASLIWENLHFDFFERCMYSMKKKKAERPHPPSQKIKILMQSVCRQNPSFSFVGFLPTTG